MLDSERDLEALSTLRTPAMTEVLGWAASRSRMRRPVWPVDPATTTVGVLTEAGGSSSAKAERGESERREAATRDWERRARRVERSADLLLLASSEEAKRANDGDARTVAASDGDGVVGAKADTLLTGRRKRERVAENFMLRVDLKVM